MHRVRSFLRNRPLLLLLLLVVVSLTLYACTNITTGSTTATGGNSSQSQGGGGPQASPSPGQGGDLPPGSFVRVGLFGQSCPSGTTAPSNGTRQILPGCVGFVTATPKDAQSNDLPAAVHGPNCTWSVPFGSGVVNVSAPSEPFNRDVRCSGVGPFGLQAQVKNVTGSADFSCEAGASRSSAEIAAFGLLSREQLAAAGIVDVTTVGDRTVYWTEIATPQLRARAVDRILSGEAR